MRFWGLVLVGLCGLPAPVAADQNCSAPTGIMDLKEQGYFATSAMHGHVLSVTCIASAMVVGNYENASHIAKMKLGLKTKGGTRSDEFGYIEPSQEMWERGYAFRTQATRFAASANAAHRVSSEENQNRAHREFLELLTHCEGCHATLR